MFRFDFTVPSVMILVIFLGYFLFEPRLPVRKNRLYVTLILLEIVVLLFDILSSRADMDYQNLPLPLVTVLNMGFFVFFIARILWFFLYTINILHCFPRKVSTLILVSLAAIVSEAITVSSFWTGAVFFVDAQGYHRGPLYNVIYVCFFFYLILSIFVSILKRRNVTRFELITLLCCNGILITGNIVRILMPQYLVMNTFCLMALLVLYLSFEDPAIYISAYGSFTFPALEEYIEERVKRENYRVLGFSLRNFSDSQAVYGLKQMDQGVALICAFLQKKYPMLLSFYLRTGCFAVAGKEDMDYETIYREIEERFRRSWVADETELFLSVNFVQISSESGIDSSEQVIESLMLTLFGIGRYEEGTLELIDLDNASVIEREVSVKRALERAVEEDTVEVFFQPLIDAQTGEVIAAEALARIRDDQGEIIPPIEFIGLAEKNGQINRLGDQVLEKVCRYIQEYGMEAPKLQWINVNLSPIQCMNRELSERFVGILEKYAIPPSYIHLEITEASMIDFEVLQEQMNILWNKGFCFALDDYGSGYSNLARVKRFPFSNIKLDMEVVRQHCEHPDKVLPVFVGTFKEIGFTITAEGIENEKMAEEMVRIGCDYLQGYLYSKPICIRDFLEKYKDYSFTPLPATDG